MPPPGARKHHKTRGHNRQKPGDRRLRQDKETPETPDNRARRHGDKQKNNNIDGRHENKRGRDRRQNKYEDNPVGFRAADTDIEKQTNKDFFKTNNPIEAEMIQPQPFSPVPGKKKKSGRGCCGRCRWGCAITGVIIFIIVVGIIGVIAWLVIIPAAEKAAKKDPDGGVNPDLTKFNVTFDLTNYTSLPPTSSNKTEFGFLVGDLMRGAQIARLLHDGYPIFKDYTDVNQATRHIRVSVVIQLKQESDYSTLQDAITQELSNHLWVYNAYQVVKNSVIVTVAVPASSTTTPTTSTTTTISPTITNSTSTTNSTANTTAAAAAST